MGLNRNQFLIDTNILIDYLADCIPSPGIEKLEKIIELSLQVSVITQIEFMGWHNHTNQSKAAAEEMMAYASIIPMNTEVVIDTITLKQQMRIKTPDAIIAASSRVHHMTLITGNDAHFQKVPGVTIYNPWKDTDSR